MIAATTTATDRLARFVEGFTFGQIPGDVLKRTKEVIYDGLGALLAATSKKFDYRDVITRIVQDAGGTPESQIFNLPLRTNAANAALWNGALGYYCDIESHHAGAIMHAIAVVGPAAYAVGEKMGSSGKDVLTAIVVGIDVACRVSYALSAPALYDRGFHPTCVAGTFGSLAAAARLFGLRGEALRRAFGLAGTETSGLLAWVDDDREHARPYNMGLASRHGVSAAHLAWCGFSGPPHIFESKYPLGKAFTGEWHDDALFEGLGERFMVMELFFKLYASCAFTHPGLDGLLDIVKTEHVTPNEIEHITLRFPRSGYHVIDNNPLRSHCAQYVFAIAVHKGQIDFEDILNDRRLTDPSVAALFRKIEVAGDDETEKTYPDLYRSIVEVKTSRGTFVRDVVHPKGSPQNAVPFDELVRKFERITADAVSPDRRRKIAEATSHLEELPRISELTKLLAP